MATTIQLKQGDSGTTLTLNSSGSTGFRLEEDGWNPAIANPVHMGDPPPVLERFDLLLSQINYNNLASSMQSLHEMQVIADRYINDPTQEDPVWLLVKMDGETNTRRALVRNISIQYTPSWFGAGQSTTNVPLVVMIERGPYWESTTARDLPDSGNKSGACVVYDYTAAGAAVSAHDIVGDVGARLRFFDIKENQTQRYWMGIRSANKRGATGISNFQHIWECEDGVNNANESGITDQVDATASGGDRVQVVETDLDWDEADFKHVLLLTQSAQSLNEEDQIGNFLWLLRAKVTAGTWEVRLRVNIFSNTYGIDRDIVEISDTDWLFYEMAVAQNIDRNIHAIIDGDVSLSDSGSFGVSIYARRTSGSGNLYVDCLVPIPVDEGFLQMICITTGGQNKAVGQSPEGIWGSAEWVDTTGVYYLYNPSPTGVENFSLPPGDGRIYAVFDRGTSSVITDDVIFNDGDIGKYYERWLSLRGNE